MTDEQTQEIEAAESPEETVTPEPMPDDLLPYTMGEWSGLPLWKCRYCLYATPDGEYEFYTHLRRHLNTGEIPEPTGLVDSRGNPIQ